MKRSLSILALTVVSSIGAAQLGATRSQFKMAQEAFLSKLQATRDLERMGEDLASVGLLSQAESLYLEAKQLSPGPTEADRLLAQLYDLQGRDEKARRCYREYLRRKDHASGWSRSDPRILARFGDLSLKYGFVDDAKNAYAAAAKTGPDGTFDPRTVPPQPTIGLVKAGAHAAAAWEHGTHSSTELALSEAKLAVEADPTWWVPHYYLGRAYVFANQRAEGLKELAIAEKVAPPSGLAQIKSIRQLRL